MPSPYSSSATQDDARALAAALGTQVHEFQIAPVMGTYETALQAEFVGREQDLTGGFALIKDVPKTLVYRLCTWRNSDAGALAADTIASQAGGPQDGADDV